MRKEIASAKMIYSGASINILVANVIDVIKTIENHRDIPEEWRLLKAYWLVLYHHFNQQSAISNQHVVFRLIRKALFFICAILSKSCS